jgi:hypothetical protein
METTEATTTTAAVTAAMATMTMTTAGSGGGQSATAAANGSLVWGRCQVAGGRGNGNKAEMGTMWV